MNVGCMSPTLPGVAVELSFGVDLFFGKRRGRPCGSLDVGNWAQLDRGVKVRNRGLQSL